MYLPPVEWYIIAEEKHKDGTPHLHIGLELKTKIHLSGSKGLSTLNLLVTSQAHPNGHHGDYAAMKSIRGTVDYLTKEMNYLHHGIDLEAVRAKKGGTPETKIVAEKILEGATPEQILQQHPSYYLLKRRNIVEFHYDTEQLKKSKIPIKKLNAIHLGDGMAETSFASLLMNWLNENLSSQALPRVFKQKQLWLYGPSNVGKSSLLNKLQEGLRVYPIPPKEYYCGYNDELFDLAILDEYGGSKTITFLNQWLEGAHIPLDQKNKVNYIKKKNIPTIICSNFSPEEVYKKAPAVQITALLNRLEVICATEFIKLIFEWEE